MAASAASAVARPAKSHSGRSRHPRANRRGEERDPGHGGERQHAADGIHLARRREEEEDRRQPGRLRPADRPLDEPRGEKDGEDEARAHGRRVRAAHEDDDGDRREKRRVARLAADARGAKHPEHEAGGEGDVKPRDDEQVVEPAAPVARDHPAVELRSASEKKRRERASHVALEGGVARGKPREEEAVRPLEERERRRAPRLDQPRTLDREAIARPRQRDVARRGGEILRTQLPRDDDAVAAIRRAESLPAIRRRRGPPPRGTAAPFRPLAGSPPGGGRGLRGGAPDQKSASVPSIRLASPGRLAAADHVRDDVSAGIAMRARPERNPAESQRTDERRAARPPAARARRARGAESPTSAAAPAAPVTERLPSRIPATSATAAGSAGASPSRRTGPIIGPNRARAGRAPRRGA